MSQAAYASRVLQMAVAQICHAIGWDASQPTALEQLVSITEHFLRESTRHMVRYGELSNRSEPNLDDLACAFRAMAVDMDALVSFTDNVESVPLPFSVPRFPVVKKQPACIMGLHLTDESPPPNDDETSSEEGQPNQKHGASATDQY